MVEEDLQRIGQWVTQQSEALHTRLSKLLANCSDESYPVDYLRGAPRPRRAARAAALASMRAGS